LRLQLFEDNFVHADLHAGNIMLREVTDSYGIKHPQLVLLDAGLTAELGPYDQRNFVGLFRAVIDNDGREVGRLMMEGNQMRDKNGRRIPVIKPEEYQDEMAKLVAYVHAKGLSLKNVSVSDLLRDVLRLSYDHNVKLESRFVTVVVALMLAEGMGRRLDPDVDIIKRATPFIRAAAIRKFMGYK
jgi:aarF domain-containing kinase